MKLAEIAKRLNLRLEGGQPEREVTGVAGIEEAGPDQLTFVSNPKYAPLATSTRAAAVIVDEHFPAISPPTLRSKNPYLSFAHAVELFYLPPSYSPGIHPTAVIHSSAQVGKNASIGPYVHIGPRVRIGANCVLVSHVVIYEGAQIGDNFFAHAHSVVREHCRVGDNVVLQNGAVIGADGFGFAKDDHGVWQKIVQSGPAIIGDDVEVQANACIDRASIGETRIERGTKIDNLVQVGHGSRVGANSLLCAQAGLAGSSKLGRHVILAGQAGVAGHCTLGDGVVVTAQSGTHGDIPAGKTVSGSPAMDNRLWLRVIAALPRLPELIKVLRKAGKAPDQR
jgi:UDP-3-O-[3-hydroxymyristoyl] glucosamine N-acyltransferase